MWLSVTRNSEGTNGLVNLPITEILFLEFDPIDRCIFVHTREEQFYLAGTLAYWATTLEQYDFEKVDRNFVVQVPMIQRMDTAFFMAYFDGEITLNSKKVTMSQKYFRRIMKRITQTNSNMIII